MCSRFSHNITYNITTQTRYTRLITGYHTRRIKNDWIRFTAAMDTKKSSDFDPVQQNLFTQSNKARELAYVPYSNFQVGAALLCEDGTIITGCNVENSSYPLTTCAERTAIVKAVSEGHKNFVSIAISATLNDNFVSPCGSCRQVLSEFDKDSKMIVYLVKPTKDEIFVTTLENLLPLSFRF